MIRVIVLLILSLLMLSSFFACPASAYPPNDWNLYLWTSADAGGEGLMLATLPGITSDLNAPLSTYSG